MKIIKNAQNSLFMPSSAASLGSPPEDVLNLKTNLHIKYSRGKFLISSETLNGRRKDGDIRTSRPVRNIYRRILSMMDDLYFE